MAPSSIGTTPDTPPTPRPAQHLRPTHAPLRLGCVSYLNTLPLIEGLRQMDGLALTAAPPAELIGKLTSNEVDAALVSLIDYQHSTTELTLMPVGMIASPAQTHTVRLFSRTPIDRITTLCVDAESHTSVALARIILGERFGVTPAIREIRWGEEGGESDARECDAVLLIGDKVATRAPAKDDYPHQLDLGGAWREMTGLPFVYAMWMCRAEDSEAIVIAQIAAVLDRTRRHNATRLGWIANTRAATHKWDAGEAGRYLRELLKFDVDGDARCAVERFFDLAHARGLIGQRRPTRWLGE